MYKIEELNLRLLSELKEIAEQLGVKNYKKLAKQELIYGILDTQASNPEKKLPTKKPSSEAPKRAKRVNVKKEQEEKVTEKNDLEKSADELLESFDLDLSSATTSSDTEEKKSDEKPAKREVRKAVRHDNKGAKEARSDKPKQEASDNKQNDRED